MKSDNNSTPPTLEEAPSQLRPWLRQRTRWIKGHLQTWLVLMRKPFTAAREIGVVRFMATQLTFGGALLASAVHAPLLIWFLAGVLFMGGIAPWHRPVRHRVCQRAVRRVRR
jgi:cellulose synthase/poly-beta-1,6-N-acetylglucosamine synthase-like glycosyltransferase